MSKRRNPVTIADLEIISSALQSHIEALNSFLSDTSEGDEVDGVIAERSAAIELRNQIERVRP